MTPASERVRPAVHRDRRPILALRRSAEQWLAAQGIDQWRAGDVSLDDVTDQIAAGQWHVLRAGDVLAGALRLLWSDEQIWQQDNGFAAYVHGLVVDRSHTGHGVGAGLLQWAADQGRAAGARELRLDCGESNLRLRSYYAQQGFQEVGRRDFDGAWFSVVLLTRPLFG
jgi:GNAT superfamily N-acetyltransferase